MKIYEINLPKITPFCGRTPLISKDGKTEKPVALKLTFTNVSDKTIKFNAFDLGVTGINGYVKALPADSVSFDIIGPGQTGGNSCQVYLQLAQGH